MKLTLNLDFYDMFHDARPASLDRDGYYHPEELAGLIGRAADAGFSTVNFRTAVCGKAFCRSKVKEWIDTTPEMCRTMEDNDPLAVAIGAAHDAGIACNVWITPFDDMGGKPPSPDGPALHQSVFSFEHPEYQLCSRDGTDRIWGVYCFGYPEVREYWLAHIEELLEYGPDGIFISNRTHSNMDVRCREYGFNQPVIERYRELYDGDPREDSVYDLARFSGVLGDFYTQFLSEAAALIHGAGKRVMAGVSWQRSGRIADRLGALDKCFFQWERWLADRLVDDLVIGGDAATGCDPEHVLGHYEVNADSCNPAHFRRAAGPATLQRWLTLFSWLWPDPAALTADGKDFGAAAIDKMLARVAASGVDGVVIHEAMCIERQGFWSQFGAFAGR